MKIYRIRQISLSKWLFVTMGMLASILMGWVINSNQRSLLIYIIVIILTVIVIMIRYDYALILFPLASFFTAATIPNLGFSLEKLLASIFVFAWMGEKAINRRYSQSIKYEQTPFPLKVRILFFLLLLENLVSLLGTSSLPDGLIAYQAIIAKGLLVYLVYEVVKTERQYRASLYALLVLTIMAGLAATYVVAVANDFNAVRDYYFRVAAQDPVTSFLMKYTVLRSPNILADYALLLGPIMFGLVLHDRGWSRYLAFVGLVLIEAGLLLSQTRAAYIAAFAQYVLMFIIWRKHALGWLPIILGGILILNISSLVQQDYRFQFLQGSFDTFSDSEPVQSRTVFYEIGRQTLQDRPIFGGGLGSFETLSSKYGSSEIQGAAAHSTFLEVAAETGYVGLFIFVILLILFYKVLIKTETSVIQSFPQKVSPSFFVAAIGLSISAAAHLTFSLSIIWYVAGLALVSSKNFSGTTTNETSPNEKCLGKY